MARVRRHQVFDLILEHLTAHHDNPQLEPALADLNAAAPHFRNAVARLMDARPSALGAASYDGPGVAGGGTSSSTERLALNPDRTSVDLTNLDAALAGLVLLARTPDGNTRAICARARTVWTITSVWTPKAATDRDRRDLTRANLDRDPGCEHHARQGAYELAAHTGTVSGNLDLPMALCSFCYWQVRRKGQLPNGDAMERHRQGKTERERIVS